MNEMKSYIKPQTEVVQFDSRTTAIMAASGERNVSTRSITTSNKGSFTYEGKENNDDDWDEE